MKEGFTNDINFLVCLIRKSIMEVLQHYFSPVTQAGA